MPMARGHRIQNAIVDILASCWKEGVYVAPSQFEAGFVSLTHSEADIDATVRAANEALSTL